MAFYFDIASPARARIQRILLDRHRREQAGFIEPPSLQFMAAPLDFPSETYVPYTPPTQQVQLPIAPTAAPAPMPISSDQFAQALPYNLSPEAWQALTPEQRAMLPLLTREQTLRPTPRLEHLRGAYPPLEPTRTPLPVPEAQPKPIAHPFERGETVRQAPELAQEYLMERMGLTEPPVPGSVMAELGFTSPPGPREPIDFTTGPGLGGQAAGLGLGLLYVAGQAAEPIIQPLDLVAQTAKELVTGRKLTLFSEGYQAALAKFRDQSLGAQIWQGIVFDPFILFQVFKIPARASTAAMRNIIQTQLSQAAGRGFSDEAITNTTNIILDKMKDLPLARLAQSRVAEAATEPPRHPKDIMDLIEEGGGSVLNRDELPGGYGQLADISPNNLLNRARNNVADAEGEVRLWQRVVGAIRRDMNDEAELSWREVGFIEDALGVDVRAANMDEVMRLAVEESDNVARRLPNAQERLATIERLVDQADAAAIERGLEKRKVTQGTEAPPPIARETDEFLQIDELADKWEGATRRNSARASRDLQKLADEGFDVSGAQEALDEYKDTVRADFGTAEEFRGARTEAWDNFVDELRQIQPPSETIFDFAPSVATEADIDPIGLLPTAGRATDITPLPTTLQALPGGAAGGQIPPGGRRPPGEGPPSPGELGPAGEQVRQGPSYDSYRQQQNTLREQVVSQRFPTAGKLPWLRRKVEELTLDRYAFVNSMAGRARTAYRETFGEELPGIMDAEVRFALSRGAPHAAKERYQTAMSDIARELGNVNIEHLNNFLKIRHNIDVTTMHPGRSAMQDGLTESEGSTTLASMRADLGDEAYERVLSAARVVRDLYRDILQRKVATGLVDPDVASLLNETYPWYNPIKYAESVGVGVVDGTPRPVITGVTDNNLFHLAEWGREVFQEDPVAILSQTIINSELAISRNGATKAAISNALLDPELQHSVSRIIDVPIEPRPIPRPGALPGDVPAALPGAITRETEEVTQTTVREVLKLAPTTSDVGRVSFFHNGQQQIWEVPRWLADQVGTLTDFNQHVVDRVGRIINAPHRAALTSHNPVFMGVNLLFDTLTVAVMEGVLPHEVFTSLLATIKNIVARDETMRQLIRHGGSIGGLAGATPETLARDLMRPNQTVLRNLSDWRTYWDAATAPLRFVHVLRELSMALETAPRRAVFKKGLEKGMSPYEAAFASRRATVDFQRYSTGVRMADAWFLYLNPGLQGSMIPIRGLLNPNIKAPFKPFGRKLPGRRAIWGIAGLMGTSMAAYAWNRQFETYRDLSDRDKLGKFIIATGETEPDEFGRKHLKSIAIVPAPREFTFFHAGLTYVLSKLDDSESSSVTAALESIVPQMNPFGSVMELSGKGANFGFGGIPVPSVPGQTITDIARNYNGYTREPIVGPELDGKPVEEQYTIYTSELAKWAGEHTGIAPVKWDHAFRIGIVADAFMAANYVLDEDAPPPHIMAAAAELANIDELYSETPDIIRRERKAFLQSIPVKDRQAVEDAAKKLDLPAEIPIVTSFKNRFYIERASSQMHTTGMQEAAELYGVSAKATREAGVRLSQLAERIEGDHEQLDTDLLEGNIDAAQWRQGHQMLGATYGAGLIALNVALPKAAQFLPTADWEAFLKSVNTGLGKWNDRRSRGEVLKAAWYAIPMDEISPGVLDVIPFFEKRDEFLAALSEEDVNLLELELSASRSNTEKEYNQDMNTLRAYWDKSKEAREGKSKTIQEIWDNYLAGNKTQKRQIRNQYGAIITELAAEVQFSREFLRSQNPDMEVLLVKWGYIDIPLTMAGQRAMNERLARMKPVQPEDQNKSPLFGLDRPEPVPVGPIPESLLAP